MRLHHALFGASFAAAALLTAAPARADDDAPVDYRHSRADQHCMAQEFHDNGFMVLYVIIEGSYAEVTGRNRQAPIVRLTARLDATGELAVKPAPAQNPFENSSSLTSAMELLLTGIRTRCMAPTPVG